MPEQSNMDNYAYERDLILLNNLLMKRLLQQRMRMSNTNENNNNKPKKTISDVYGPSTNLANTTVARETKKNYSMVEARKTTHINGEQSILNKRSSRTPQTVSRNTPTRSNNNSNNTSQHSNSTNDQLSTVNEETISEKQSPVNGERLKKRTTSTSSGEESSNERQTSAPGTATRAPTVSSSISSTPESEQSFRKNTPTRHSSSMPRKSIALTKIAIKQLPTCKQTNGKCCEESNTNKKSTNCNQCPTNNVCTNVPQRPYFPPPPMNNVPLQNPFRSFNFQTPALNPSFYYPYNNSFNYPLIRTNFNSFPQFNPLQPYNFQSNPFYLQAPNFFQPRPLEPLKPLKPMQMSHFQPTNLNGQAIIVL